MGKFINNKIPPFTGTRNGITIYKMWGEYYARSKSSLTGKRVKKDPVFRRTMENANRLGEASRIASGIYRLIPVECRQHALYRQLTGHAMRLLKENVPVKVIEQQLIAIYMQPVKKEVLRIVHRIPQVRVYEGLVNISHCKILSLPAINNVYVNSG